MSGKRWKLLSDRLLTTGIIVGAITIHAEMVCVLFVDSPLWAFGALAGGGMLTFDVLLVAMFALNRATALRHWEVS